ncbi:hypothetical protein C8R43DRAFT_1030483 [Mycena crocata]|nr:hypothetical protein C8R43DRAFT_1030483 [Mycena crocata]
MPRCLNLTGVTPIKSPCVQTPPSSGSKSRRSSLVSFDDSPRSRRSPRDSGYGASPFITPLKLESGLPGKSVDFVARIRSAFYKRQGDYEDEHEDVRDFFNRDSRYSDLALDHTMDVIKDTTDQEGPEDHTDDEVDYGRPISIRSTFYSPSRESPSGLSFDGPKLLSPLSCAVSSDLPYLHGSNPDLSPLSSISSGALDDLLASVELKYPGGDWGKIVKFGDKEDEYEGVNTPVEIVKDDKQQQHWSEIVGFDEYAN